MTQLEADLKFIQKNLEFALTWIRNVFRKYGDVDLKSCGSGCSVSLKIALEGRTVYSYHHYGNGISRYYNGDRKPDITWHYDSPKIREAIASAVRECSRAIHKRIEELKAKEKAHNKKVSDEKRAFEEK